MYICMVFKRLSISVLPAVIKCILDLACTTQVSDYEDLSHRIV